MNHFETGHFGTITYELTQAIQFPEGLPAFDDERSFLLIEQPATAPVIFLQSLTQPDLVFMTLPVELVEPFYQLTVGTEDLEALGLPSGRQPLIGADVLCLAIVTVADGCPPTANLLAPVLVNVRNRQARQVIQTGSGYSHQHRLAVPSAEERC